MFFDAALPFNQYISRRMANKAKGFFGPFFRSPQFREKLLNSSITFEDISEKLFEFLEKHQKSIASVRSLDERHSLSGYFAQNVKKDFLKPKRLFCYIGNRYSVLAEMC